MNGEEKPKPFAEGLWISVKAAFLATLCCSTPLILVPLFMLFGVGSITAALRIPEHKTFFMALSIVFMLISLYINIKNRNKGVCNIKTVYHERWFIATVIAAYAILTLLMIYFLFPLIAEWVYGRV